MFKKARLKLTAWYLLIIVVICLFFTIPTYRFLTREVERFSKAQRFRIEEGVRYQRVLPPITEDLVVETKKRIAFQLGTLNLIIVVISGGLSYFLAGITLQPIKQMVDEQYRFISDSSHELRTPITSLKTSIEVALMDKKANLSELRSVLTGNLIDTQRLQTLSENLLTLTISKSLPIQVISPVNLNKLTAHSITGLTNIFKNKKITLINKVESISINTSEKELSDILTILLDNAIKYSQKGAEVTIASQKNSSETVISVTDKGIGINKKDLPYVFDRFFRSDNARTVEKNTGFGLGLSIADKLATQIKAKITVKSKIGEGSTFCIHLPNNFS